MRRRCYQPFGICFLGRLPALTVAATLGALVGAACDQERKAPPAPKARHAAVRRTEPTASSPTKPRLVRSRQVIAKRQGKLCGGKLGPGGKAMPTSEISRANAPGADPLPETLPVARGKWTWVNFWAAWCVPCKEEIPRLLAWERKLNQSGTPFRLVFVSLDDDTRQLQGFLSQQPADQLRASYWLRDGEEREKWFAGVDLDSDPELPAHLLVDPQGKLRCVVKGAVEDGDYEQLTALVRG
jgi:thiol-disulfide isomerase/thioredoxin